MDDIYHNRYELIKNKIKEGFDINFIDENMETPLSLAIRLLNSHNHDDKIINLLLDNNVDVSLGWEIALREAGYKNYTDLMSILISRGANINKAIKNTSKKITHENLATYSQIPLPDVKVAL